MNFSKNYASKKNKKKNKKKKKHNKALTKAKNTAAYSNKVQRQVYQAGSYGHYQRAPCHKGNNRLFTLGEKDGGLYIGGWSRGAYPGPSWAVIDLSGDGKLYDFSPVEALNKSGQKAFAGSLRAASSEYSIGPWLSLPIRDFGTPRELDRPYWLALASDVKTLLETGTNVLLACYGGHGRSGMVACILTGLLRPDLTADDPVHWLWENYCSEAVETRGQELYIYKILDIDPPATLAIKPYIWQGQVKPWTETKATTSSAIVKHDAIALDRDNLNDDDVVNRWEYDDGVVVEERADGSFASTIDEDYNDEPKNETCPECRGLGYLVKKVQSYTDDDISEWEDTKLCPKCDGFGVTPKLLNKGA